MSDGIWAKHFFAGICFRGSWHNFCLRDLLRQKQLGNDEQNQIPAIFSPGPREINLENLFALSVSINGIVKQRTSRMFIMYIIIQLYYVYNNIIMISLPFFCHGYKATSNITGNSNLCFLLTWFHFLERKFLAE